jgi:hypothetical protein
MSYANLLLITQHKSREMQTFIREQRLKMEKDEDFIRALKYYDQL